MRLLALTCSGIVLALIACSDSPKTIGPRGLSALAEEAPVAPPCPDDFVPLVVKEHPADRNGDGIVCVKAVPPGRKPAANIIFIDNPHPLLKRLELQGCLVGFVAVQSPGDEADQNGDGTVCQQDIGIPNVVAVTVSLDN